MTTNLPACWLDAAEGVLRSSSCAEAIPAAGAEPGGAADGKPAPAPSSAQRMLTDAPVPQPLSEQRPARSSISLPIKQVLILQTGQPDLGSYVGCCTPCLVYRIVATLRGRCHTHRTLYAQLPLSQSSSSGRLLHCTTFAAVQLSLAHDCIERSHNFARSDTMLAGQDRASRAAQHREEDPGLVWDVPPALGVPQAGPWRAVMLGMHQSVPHVLS